MAKAIFMYSQRVLGLARVEIRSLRLPHVGCMLEAGAVHEEFIHLRPFAQNAS
jgi:hypothetical protein